MLNAWGEDVSRYAELYADGGVCGMNPSPVGGVFAWTFVDPDGRQFVSGSGHVTADELGVPTVGNNVTELLAVLVPLTLLPHGWPGRVYTDSGVTLTRFVSQMWDGKTKLIGVPESIRAVFVRECARIKIVRTRWTLLGGHPTKEDLARGRRDNGGLPVSKWNQWCDDECGREKERHKRGGWAARALPLFPERPQ